MIMKQNIGQERQNSNEINVLGSVKQFFDFLKSVIAFKAVSNTSSYMPFTKKRVLLSNSLPENNIDLSPVVDNTLNPIADKIESSLPLEKPFTISKLVIESYLKSFHEVAINEINPLINFNISLALFNFGAIFIIRPYTAPEKQDFNSKNVTFNLFNSSQRTVLDAFNDLGIDLTKCLAEDENKNLQISLKANQPYFLGTNIVYEENAIFLIKDSTNQAWHEDAAKKDVQRIYNEIQELPS